MICHNRSIKSNTVYDISYLLLKLTTVHRHLLAQWYLNYDIVFDSEMYDLDLCVTPF